MSKPRLKYLLLRYASNEASKQEVEEMLLLIKSSEGTDELRKFVANMMSDPEKVLPVSDSEWEKLWETIKSSERPYRQSFYSRSWLKYAASVVLLLGCAATFLIFKNRNTPITKTPLAHSGNHMMDIKPGGDRAILTFASGKLIKLDTLPVGAVIQEQNCRIKKISTYTLVYSMMGLEDKSWYNNKISTPAGGQYEIILPDHSKVRLNASSSLEFPTSFSGKERTVTLVGEAYFEVAHAYVKQSGKKMPFIVHAGDLNVEVMGTHFNIKAYADEPETKTTLLEGKVKISRKGISKILMPGQQAITDHKASPILVKSFDDQEPVAWKDGLFRFRETNIEEIMKEVQRWYNVSVEYKTRTEGLDFTGMVARTKNVSALLQTLELTGSVHFQVVQDDRKGSAGKILVLP
ncbi:MAG: FecR domain-containing protein [Bacteroidetes bacterium]|nr:FecR domain-containing protein [Bacteroidota bacterium]